VDLGRPDRGKLPVWLIALGAWSAQGATPGVIEQLRADGNRARTTGVLGALAAKL